MFKNLFYTEYTFVFASVLLVWDAKIVCVDWVCHTEILRVVGDQGVPSVPQPECCKCPTCATWLTGSRGGSPACPALPGGQLAHLGPQRHEVHIPTGTPWSAATQNTLCQLEHLCHQQHEKPSGQIGLRGVIKINGVVINKWSEALKMHHKF